MAATRYVVAATPSHEAKVISNPKSAKREADARAKTDRVDVQVTTIATGRVTYTAQGAITTPTPADPEPVQDDVQDDTFAAETADADAAGEEAGEEEFNALLNEVKEEAAAERPANAPCGCPVDAIIANGEHGKGCADAPATAARTRAVKKAAPKKATGAPRTGAGRRAALGQAAVDGWELLYDKPRQNAQVGRKDGQYALICTTHKFVRPVAKLVEERAVRKAGGWCEHCSH